VNENHPHLHTENFRKSIIGIKYLNTQFKIRYFRNMYFLAIFYNNDFVEYLGFIDDDPGALIESMTYELSMQYAPASRQI
jgi:hypothetical protein